MRQEKNSAVLHGLALPVKRVNVVDDRQDNSFDVRHTGPASTDREASQEGAAVVIFATRFVAPFSSGDCLISDQPSQ